MGGKGLKLCYYQQQVRYLHSYEETRKTRIIHEQLKASSTRKFGTNMYDPTAIVRAFDYFSTSRALYYKLKR